MDNELEVGPPSCQSHTASHPCALSHTRNNDGSQLHRSCAQKCRIDAVGLFCDCEEHCGGVRRPLDPTAYCKHTKYHTSPLMKTIKKFLGRVSELCEPGTSSNASGSAADAKHRRVEVHVSAYNHSTHELTCPVAAGYQSWAVLRIWMSSLCEPQGYSTTRLYARLAAAARRIPATLATAR